MLQAFALWGWAQAGGIRAGTALLAWVEQERGRFAPWLAVAMGAGVLCYLGLGTEPPSWAGLAAMSASTAAAILLRQLVLARAACLLGVAASFGLLAGQVATWRALPPVALPTKAVVLSGHVHSVEVVGAARRMTLADVHLGPGAAPTARLVRLRLRGNDPAQPWPGDQVHVRALVRPPAPPAYPGAWDLQRDAWFTGMAGYGMALGPVEIVDRGAPGAFGTWMNGLRQGINRRLLDAMSPTAGPIAAALLTGSASAMPAADRAAFRDSGLAHLLAVAGLHIGAVMGLVFWLTRLCLAAWERAALHWPLRVIAGVLALAAGGGYAALTGGHLPVLRSLAMASLVTLGLVLGRRALSVRGLALAACVLLAWSPHESTGVSFQMSFSAVLALIAGFEAVRPVLTRLHTDRSWWRRTGAHVLALALTSALAGTASAPYGAYHFGHVQLYYVAANLVAVPLCAMLALPMGLLALILMPLGLEAIALVPMGWVLGTILWIGRSVSAWPGAVLAVPHLPGWGLCVFSIGLAWLCLWRSRIRLAGIGAMAIGLSAGLWVHLPDLVVSADARLIAVRSGQGVLLQSGAGANAFTRDAIVAYYGREVGTAFPKPGAAARDGLDCDPTACRTTTWTANALILRNSMATGVTCRDVAILISPEPARGTCSDATPMIDRFTVWRDGAHAVWLGDERARVLSDRDYRGIRPWVPPPPTPRRIVPTLPMAETE